ncbi:NTE family protein [Silvimonas terrae]|uniref:NTE family protein n=1 Tax=Silvimonas terrae TaxID=300266 RepID=A0A840R925_9NEIS|nr:patatin-like phospholipase family protein [Silvimonas terrae]MBB5189397.1 NTE family protein [Silvimonas terrae]
MFGRSHGKPVLSLALQGGGAHGAFTWGVLDALLEAGHYRIEGISGTSAGAMNAMAVAQGLTMGGPDYAREMLAAFWQRVADSLPKEMTQPLGTDLNAPVGMQMVFHLTRWFSPYQLNPLDYNPLRKIIESLFDFEIIRRAQIKLFVAATNANTGHLKLFQNAELSADALLASACLPSLQQAVMIDGEAYWDGGYAANPAVFPLFKFCESDDILLVLLAPLVYGETPRTASDIQRRAMMLGFNSAFLREMRLFALLQEMAQDAGLIHGQLERQLRSMRFHAIQTHPALAELDPNTQATTHGPFLTWLRDEGRSAAHAWLQAHGHEVGRRSTLDLKDLFLKEWP